MDVHQKKKIEKKKGGGQGTESWGNIQPGQHRAGAKNRATWMCIQKKKREKKKGGPGHRELRQHTARANLVWTPEI